MRSVIAEIGRETRVGGSDLLTRIAVVATIATAMLFGAAQQGHASSEPAQSHSDLKRPVTRAEAATAAAPATDAWDLTSAVIRMRPLDISALDAAAFGDWDPSAQAATGIEARER